MSQSVYGAMMTVGFISYFLGKICFGPLVDMYGGRMALMSTLLGSSLGSLLFSLGHSANWFYFCWIVIRFAQPGGWIGLIKLCGAWVPASRRGRVMGLLSCSFLVGGALTRVALGGLVDRGLAWREVFIISASLTALFAIPTWFILLPGPESVGLPPVEEPRQTEKAQKRMNATREGGLLGSLKPVVGTRRFVMLCSVTIPLVVMRE
jgi:sugar phosphate permease